MIGELLYQLTARDQQVTWLEAFRLRVQTATAAVRVTGGNVQVPTERLLLVTQCGVLGRPGASQKFLGWAWYYTDSASVQHIIAARTLENTFVTGAFYYDAQLASVGIVPPGAFISYEGVFNSGVASNQADGFISGFLIPRGNVAL